MRRVLPDTSIWVEFLRHGTGGPAAALDDLLAEEIVLVTGPVVAELLAGTARRASDELWLTLSSIPWADLDPPAWRQVGLVASELRARGESMAVTDLAIAVAAVRAGASVWTRDLDFARIQVVLPQLELFQAH